MILCDTSVIAKLYVQEHESPAVRRLFESADTVALSELARPELMSVFLAAVRQFTQDDVGNFWTWLPLDKTILDAAAQTFATLPETVFLRSSDCLHLVTALHYNFAEIHTYDHHQAKAASALGLKAVVA